MTKISKDNPKGFDLIIIGGGAGAFAAAIRANELQARTALINAGLPLGGTCVNVGCVPSKTLLWAGEVLNLAKHHHIPGIALEVKKFNFQAVVQDELALVKKLRQEKYARVLQNLKHVEFIAGRAQFISRTKVRVALAQNPIAEHLTLQGKKFIVATGSSANVPQIEGIKEVGFLTHVEALKLEKLPQSLVVIGAGPLGLEFAQMFVRFGAKVTMLQRGPFIFPPGERELTTRLKEVLEKEGIAIKTDVAVKAAKKLDNKKQVVFEIDGKEQTIEAQEILLAAGKTPNTQGLGLEKAEVETDQKAVVVNHKLQTSNPNIFAVGDVTNAPLRLETTAGREGTLAVENAFKGTALSVDYKAVPYTVFTDPQLAGVGLTEEQQMRQMGSCACRTVAFSSVPKALIMRRTEGLIKMVVHPQTKQVLGVHLLAPNAGEIIAQAMMLVKNKNTVDDVAASLPVFPTLSEALKIVALSFSKDVSKLSCCI